jgi:hypothetical protein
MQSPIQSFSLSGGLLSNAAVAKTAKNYGLPGVLSISANGAENGILWGVDKQNTGSALLAFNATNLKYLYASSPLFDFTESFVGPMVANGKVYVPTEENLVVSGLLAKNLITGGNQQTGQVGTILATPLSVTVTDAYHGAGLPGVTVNFSDGGSGGGFSDSSPVTNSSGVAVTNYTLPSQPGSYKITVSASGLTTAHFTETAKD